MACVRPSKSARKKAGLESRRLVACSSPLAKMMPVLPHACARVALQGKGVVECGA